MALNNVGYPRLTLGVCDFVCQGHEPDAVGEDYAGDEDQDDVERERGGGGFGRETGGIKNVFASSKRFCWAKTFCSACGYLKA